MMGQKELTRRYNKMVAGIEDAQIYDGRGTYDLYQCNTCNNRVITTYEEKGVTPFTMQCPACKRGVMAHVHTYPSVPEGTKVLGWYRPTLKQFLKAKPGLQEHILNGGLILKSEF